MYTLINSAYEIVSTLHMMSMEGNVCQEQMYQCLRHDTARISTNQSKSNLTAHTDIYIITLFVKFYKVNSKTCSL